MPDDVTKTAETAPDHAAEAAALKAQLETERQARVAEAQKREAAEKNYNALSVVHKQTKAKLEAVERRPRQVQEQEYEPENEPVQNGQPVDVKARNELGMIRFRMEHPEANDHWTEMMEIINDPLAGKKVLSFDDDGLVDTYATFENAMFRVQTRKLLAAKKSDDTKSQEEADKKAALARAGTPGGGAFQQNTIPDLRGKSAAEQRQILVERGLITYDRNDPPSWARQKG